MRDVRSLVTLAHVASVAGSIAFHEQLGFTVGNTHRSGDADEPSWAWLRNDGAQLVVAGAAEPVVPALAGASGLPSRR